MCGVWPLFKMKDFYCVFQSLVKKNKNKKKNVGNMGKMSASGYSNLQFKPWLHQYVVSLSKAL